MRKQIPPEKTKDVLEFATKRPRERLESIKNGLTVRQSDMLYIAEYITLFFSGLGLLAIRLRAPVWNER